MAKSPQNDKDKPTAPRDYAVSSPQSPMLDHSFTLQAIMEMQKSLGSVGEKVSKVSEDIGKLGERLGHIEKAVDRVRTGAIVAGAILSVVGIVQWWAIGDRITVAVKSAIAQSLPAATQK